MQLPALVLLVCVLGVLAAPPPIPTFSDAELQCFAQEKILYGVDGKCHKPRQRGPCPEGEWLLLAEEAGRNASSALVCRTPPCTTAAKPIFWPADRQCHKRSDKNTLCRFLGNELRTDLYGNGECACEKTYARHETEVKRTPASGEWESEGDCYPLFHRGPCPRGKIMYPTVLKGYGLVAKCFDDYCSAHNNASESGSSYVMRKEDNKCYKLGVTGPPCASDEVFAVHPMTNLPECYSPVKTVFQGGARCGGVAANINSLTGECREEVILKAQSFGFEMTRKRRTRRRTRQ